MKLSPIILGTMRFGLKSMSPSSIAELITAGHSIGCNVLHVSSEYESHGLLVESLQRMSAPDRRRCRYMVKLAGPHFGESTFDATSLEAKIDSYCAELGCDSLAMVQWMWRSESPDDDDRCIHFSEKVDEINQCFSRLLEIGKVQAFSCFPYSSKFMKISRDKHCLETQVNYLNLYETAATDAGIGSSTIVLRPYAGGRVFKEETKTLVNSIAKNDVEIEIDDLPKLSIQFPFYHPNIDSVVVSCSRIEELEDCCEVQSNTTSNLDNFAAVQGLQKKIITEASK